MTREQIAAMPAGAELDAAVGRAMGVTPGTIWIVTADGGKSARASVDERHGPWYSEQELRSWLAREQSQGLHRECEISTWEKWPRYSTDVRAAVELIEKLPGLDMAGAGVFTVHREASYVGGKAERWWWVAGLVHDGWWDGQCRACHEKYEVAVCHAALLWLAALGDGKGGRG